MSEESTLEVLNRAIRQEVSGIRAAILDMTQDELDELVMALALIKLDDVDPDFVAARHVVGRAGNAAAIMEAIDNFYSG